ncbi:MAG: DUF3943 domain-containing protein [Usitatibacter sp.]
MKSFTFLLGLALPLAALAQEGAPRPALPDLSREIEANKSHAIPAAEIVGFDFLLNRVDKHYFGCCDYDVSTRTIRRNLHSRWDVDRDPFVVNQLGHPYQGSMYHGFARASGLGYWEGLAYTFAGSAFWEVFGETTRPSVNDQINTGIGGSFLGEALFRMANLLLEHDEWPVAFREVGAAAISPPTGFNRLAFGERFRRPFASRGPVYFTRLQVGYSGETGQASGQSTTRLRSKEALADFFMEYGLPGKPDYEYTRPFDYFTFQATASSANGFENSFTRGMLLGRTYAGQKYRGILGLYGNYDYIAPQTYRVSATGLSLGTTVQWRLAEKVDLMATILGGVGYTAAGTVRSVGENDFHYGLAPQAMVALRLVYANQYALDVSAREYYVSRVAAADRGGHENIARADVAFTWRVHKQHGVSIKYLANRRDARYPDLGDRLTQRRETIGVFYTLLGHDRFGAGTW